MAARTMTRLVATPLAVASLLALPIAAAAQGVPGAGELLAKDKLRAKGCGRAKIEGLQTLTLDAGGAWSALSDGGDPLAGTYVPVGKKGRSFDLAFDAPSLLAFRGQLEGYLSDLCDALVVVTTIDTKRFRLTLNKKATKARVKGKFQLAGTADGQAGKATFSVVAKGPWAAPPASPGGAFIDD